MSIPWAILTRRYGGDTRQPSQAQLLQAAKELFDEDIRGMSETDYAEHPNAFLRLGFDGGPVYLVDAYRDGTTIVSKLADQDDADPVCEVKLTGVSREKLLAMWTSLALGDLERFRGECPSCGW